ncbi:hypothetical protein BDP67DRAFT_529966 [Colletotrichum lupini]|nr:hypothetical protein BDP67DRAFT_529966 [Colletotrichum lupini]
MPGVACMSFPFLLFCSFCVRWGILLRSSEGKGEFLSWWSWEREVGSSSRRQMLECSSSLRLYARESCVRCRLPRNIRP